MNVLSRRAVGSEAGSRAVGEGRHAGAPRVGVVDLRPQPRGAEHQDEAVVAHRLDEQLDPVDPDLPQLLDQAAADVGRDPPGAAVADLAAGVEGAEIAPRRDVVGPEIEIDPERLEHAAADAVAERIVAEQPEVTRAAARVIPGATGIERPQTPRATRASRLGVAAASSSVGPPGASGRPPSPSATSSTILESLGTASRLITSSIQASTRWLRRAVYTTPPGSGRSARGATTSAATPPLRTASICLSQ